MPQLGQTQFTRSTSSRLGDRRKQSHPKDIWEIGINSHVVQNGTPTEKRKKTTNTKKTRNAKKRSGKYGRTANSTKHASTRHASDIRTDQSTTVN